MEQKVMTDPDFTVTLENGEIVVRYKGKECLRGKCQTEEFVGHRYRSIIADEWSLIADEDVKPDFEVDG